MSSQLRASFTGGLVSNVHYSWEDMSGASSFGVRNTVTGGTQGEATIDASTWSLYRVESNASDELTGSVPTPIPLHLLLPPAAVPNGATAVLSPLGALVTARALVQAALSGAPAVALPTAAAWEPVTRLLGGVPASQPAGKYNYMTRVSHLPL